MWPLYPVALSVNEYTANFHKITACLLLKAVYITRVFAIARKFSISLCHVIASLAYRAQEWGPGDLQLMAAGG